MLSEVRTVQQLALLPTDSFYVTVNGRIVDWTLLDGNATFSVHFRLRGGKGGFGSLLRSFRIHRSTNQLMCRDLSGRRLADVKEEERLRKWIEKKSEREAEKKRKRREKYEKLKAGPPKHEFNDIDYIRMREKILDEADDAFEAGIALLSTKKSDDKLTVVDPIASSGSDDEDDSLLPGPSRKAVKRKQEYQIFKRKQFKLDDTVSLTESNSSKENISQSDLSDQSEENHENELLKAKEVKKSCTVVLSKPADEGQSKFELLIEDNNNDLTENGNDLVTNEGKEAKADVSDKVVYPEINLEKFDDVDKLKELGLEHLKAALEVRGLKCGGSLEERAIRLFSVKGLKPEDYPKSIRTIPQKKKQKKIAS